MEHTLIEKIFFINWVEAHVSRSCEEFSSVKVGVYFKGCGITIGAIDVIIGVHVKGR